MVNLISSSFFFYLVLKLTHCGKRYIPDTEGSIRSIFNIGDNDTVAMLTVGSDLHLSTAGRNKATTQQTTDHDSFLLKTDHLHNDVQEEKLKTDHHKNSLLHQVQSREQDHVDGADVKMLSTEENYGFD